MEAYLTSSPDFCHLDISRNSVLSDKISFSQMRQSQQPGNVGLSVSEVKEVKAKRHHFIEEILAKTNMQHTDRQTGFNTGRYP